MLLLHCCFVTMLHSDTVTLQCCNVAFCIIAVASIFAISIIISHHLLCFPVFSNDHFLRHHLGHSFAHFWHIFWHIVGTFLELNGLNHLFAFLHYCILIFLPHSIFAFSSSFRIFVFFTFSNIFSILHFSDIAFGIVDLYLDVAFSALLYHKIVVSSSLACFMHIFFG